MAGAKREKDGLTARQRAFVDAYVGRARCNGAEAVRLAGYKPRNAQAAAAMAGHLLTLPNILEAIQKRMGEAHPSEDECLAILGEHARGDLGDFLRETPDGSVELDIVAAKESGKTRLVKKLSINRTRKVTEAGEEILSEHLSIELHDPQSAIMDAANLRAKLAEKRAKLLAVLAAQCEGMPADELSQLCADAGIGGDGSGSRGDLTPAVGSEDDPGGLGPGEPLAAAAGAAGGGLRE